MFQRIAVNMNETKSCAKLTVLSISYNIFIHTNVSQHGEIALACALISQATCVCCARILHLHVEIGYRTFYVTTEYTKQMDKSLSEVMGVVILRKPLNNKIETIFTKDNTELKRLSESNTKTILL
jgi:hypothetical protein